MPLWNSFINLFAQAAPAQVVEVPWFQEGWVVALIAVAIIAVPFLIGNWLAGAMRMADYGWRIGLVLFAVIAGAVVCYTGWPPKLGIDLSGGVILVYEVDQSKQAAATPSDAADAIRTRLDDLGIAAKVEASGSQVEVTLPGADAADRRRAEQAITTELGLRNTEVEIEGRLLQDGDQVITCVLRPAGELDSDMMDKLVGSISKRINPGGQKEVTVRRMGTDRVEVIIPQADEAEKALLMDKISTAGALEFRIVANQRAPKHQRIIELANRNPDDRQVKRGDEVVALWLPVDPTQFPGGQGLEQNVVRERNGQLEVLVLVDDPYNVTGEFLSNATLGTDYQTGGPAVMFQFNSEGARRFGAFTGENVPDSSSQLYYQLGIIMDGVLKSAPRLTERITSSGQITGNFTQQEVQFLVDILNAGSLPAALNKTPVAQYTSSAQLGKDTIRAGAFAMIAGTLAVLIFMLAYYRFAGLVANFAVVLNVMLVLAFMILIKAHLTLAGLAGLVLSVGMAVDANVLIYERMREEMERGAALRMAIRNGFARAMSTIIDSNLTTLIVGIVLYVIGTDQLRGFATTLVMGLTLNLFTAVFCSRVIFEVAERQRWLTRLRMMKLFGATSFNFTGWARPAIVLSLLVIGTGLFGVWQRGKELLGIDFTGGSAVQVVFNDPTDIGQLRAALQKTLPDVSVSAVGTGDQDIRDRRFNINTSNPDINAVEAELRKLFPGQLKTYTMQFALLDGPAAANDSRSSSDEGSRSGAEPKSDAETEAETETGSQSESDAEATPAAGEQKSDPEAQAAPAGDQSRRFDPREGSSHRLTATGLSAARPTAAAANQLAKAAALIPSGHLLLMQTAGANADKPTAEQRKSEAQSEPSDETKAAPAGDAPQSDAKKAADAAADEAAAESADTPPAAADAEPSAPRGPPTTPSSSLAGEAEPAASAGLRSMPATTASLTFPDQINQASLEATIDQGLADAGLKDVVYSLTSPDPEYTPGSSVAVADWTLQINLPRDQVEALLRDIQHTISEQPIFPTSNAVGGKVVGDTQTKAWIALGVSNLLIVLYIWLRFQNLAFGLAAVLALVHDVLIAVSALAVSAWLSPYLGFLLVDPFKISLEVVAALLTIVGFSINDTIVIFDRIREIRGKSPELSVDMVNRALNQTLSRTVITSGTTLLVTVILYAVGGEGIHPFAFTMLIGILCGTYSSLFIAAPVLLWMRKASAASGAAVPGARRVPVSAGGR